MKKIIGLAGQSAGNNLEMKNKTQLTDIYMHQIVKKPKPWDSTTIPVAT
jgi:hypothetical protein